MQDFTPWVCEKCGTHVTEAHRVCPECGEPAMLSAIDCPKCGKPSRFVNDRCVHCGTDLTNRKAAFTEVETNAFLYRMVKVYGFAMKFAEICKLLMAGLFVIAGVMVVSHNISAAVPFLIVLGVATAGFLIAQVVKCGTLLIVYKYVPSSSPLLKCE